MRIRKSDVLIAVVALCAIVAGTYGKLSYAGPEEVELDTVGLSLIVLACAGLAFRRAAPVAAGVVTVGTAIAYYAGHYPGVFAAAPALASICTTAALGLRRTSIALASAFAGIAYGVVALADTDPPPGSGIGMLGGWLVAMVVAGEVVRNRRAYLRAVEERAAEAERTKEEAALRRAGDERLWIAQELHDALTHSISIVNVHSSVAMELLHDDPDRAGQAMAAVRDAGGEAMRELRATLGALRSAPDAGADAGLARLPNLVTRVERAGLPVDCTVRGAPYDLPADVDGAAYRILQEALTNVLRHAGAASVGLVTEYRPDAVVVRVDDDGAGAEAPAGTHGMGLIGMRERAVAVGGSLRAEPRPGGGFSVRAELPVRGRA